MRKKEFIDEAVGQGSPHEVPPSVVVVPEKRRRYSGQEKWS